MQRNCLVCLRSGADRAHIKTRGSGGSNKKHNIIFLCREHHTEQHKIGILTFIRKYPIVRMKLELMGWEITDNKLFEPK
jgi:hypothetical protein